MKKVIIKVLIICLIIGGVGAGGYFGYQKLKGTKTAAAVPEYITMTASRKNLEVNVSGTGAVFAGTSKEVTAPNSGVINGLSVKLGDLIKKDSILFIVNNEQLEQNIIQSQNNVSRQQLQVNSAQEQLNKADTDEKKTSAKNQLTLANLSLKDAKDKLASDIKARDNATVKAPIDGIVVSKTFGNGDNVQAGKSILTIIDPALLKVKVAVDELDIQKIQVGQKAKLAFGALPDKVYDGSIEYISPTGTTSNNVTTYDVAVVIQKPENIKLGMNASVTISTASKENALVIPAEALIQLNGRKYVMVPSDGQRVWQNTDSSNGNSDQAQGSSTSQSTARRQNRNNRQVNGSGSGTSNGNQSGRTQNGQGNVSTASINGRMVEIKTGLESTDFIEVLEGITEGQKLIVQLPQINSSNNNSNIYNMMRNQNNNSQRSNSGGQAKNRN